MEKKDITLYKSPIIAIDDYCEIEHLQHTYWYGTSLAELTEAINQGKEQPEGAKQYVGITSTLLNFALGDAYAGWSGQQAANRDAAAERGHNVHEDIQNMCEAGLDPLTLEGWNFRNYAKEHGWTIIANEYIVDDDQSFASAIDLLFLDANGDLCIGDIKTYAASTAKAKKNRTSLQCSIYKWMFNLHNEYEIKHLYEVRLREDECEVTELPLVAEDRVIELVEAYRNEDKKYVYTPTPDWYYDIEMQYLELARQKAEIEAEMESLKENIHKLMILENMTSVRGTSTNVSIVKGRTTTKFDEARYKQDHPEEAIDYMVQTFDTKAFLKDHKKDEAVKEYITETTGEPTLRIVSV